jgi:hypothetical protein
MNLGGHLGGSGGSGGLGGAGGSGVADRYNIIMEDDADQVQACDIAHVRPCPLSLPRLTNKRGHHHTGATFFLSCTLCIFGHPHPRNVFID